ncbi:hypothetical protein [Streptomyces sp. NPDC057939]|uniref:hypothetical protein n=1 Tax=Streptomyces sp. NPDC057939 TaxID=3346284 RepID=UPI0036DFFA2D
MAVMEPSNFPEPDVRLARLASAVALPPTWPPTDAFLGDLAQRTGLRVHDLLLIADLPVPATAWLFDGTAGASGSLVSRSLALTASDRQLLRTRARSLTAPAGTLAPWQPRPYERYPPGFGSLLLRMFALRNLNWLGTAKAMCLMSGVCKAASTVGAVGRGAKQLDPEIVEGFAATLGVPVAVLAALTGIRLPGDPRQPAPEVVDTASLIWEVRHLTRDQEGELTEYAEALSRR